jgi:2-polyprenyl-3-methyl-5-hydroxy-6-metoxy-1,4-benzoquinol methylase
MTEASAKSMFGRKDAVTSGALKPTEYVICPLCGTPPEPFATDYQGFTLCRCRTCDLEFVSPRLSFKDLADHVYSDNYLPRRDSGALSPEAKDQYKKQIDGFEEIVDSRRDILDIGCGNGSFLEYARERGWKIAGVDIKLSRDARELGCPHWEGRLEEIDFGNSRFDVIRLNHVLEHTQDPLRELQICRQLLKPGGLLFVSVPNIAGLSPRLKSLQSRLKLKSKRWRHYAAMHHLFFFSPDTLKKLFRKAGYKVLTVKTPVPKKSGQNVMLEKFYRLVMERNRMASILDIYATPDSDSPLPASNK